MSPTGKYLAKISELIVAMDTKVTPISEHLRAYMATIGAKGGAKSKRILTTEEARAMAQKSALKRRANAVKPKGN